MYVCVCNAVTEDDVRGCMVDGGCRGVREVKDACGWKPGCGSCTRRLYSLVSEVSTASELADAITGGPLAPVRPADCPVPPLGVPDQPAPVGAAPAPVPVAAAPVASAPVPVALGPTKTRAADGPLVTVSDAAEATGAEPAAAERIAAPVRSRWLRDTAA
ncbi:(2Fe-2S)-binding protein [Actinomadura rupiterrae]|uniref:(2Fe-2S)-binding protein n=1 Tax=Actinomadura rupiterrae TaxID=559627 RepID=UPI0020A41FE0|nr:(2Fe-2S)-binding protein [Actinomadura rupiterrae]MCP2335399.1 bacterioferritin-associated ferredoxin [Actinomadura rupiterrae]